MQTAMMAQINGNKHVVGGENCDSGLDEWQQNVVCDEDCDDG